MHSYYLHSLLYLTSSSSFAFNVFACLPQLLLLSLKSIAWKISLRFLLEKKLLPQFLMHSFFSIVSAILLSLHLVILFLVYIFSVYADGHMNFNGRHRMRRSQLKTRYFILAMYSARPDVVTAHCFE